MIFLEQLAEHYRKFAIGFGVATAFSAAIFSIFGQLGYLEKTIIVVFVYLLCGSIAYLISRYMQTGFLKARIDNEAAQDASRLERPEEHLAHTANKFARRFFGQRRTISYLEYRSWRKRNPLVFTAVVGKQRELLGYFDIFPLNDVMGAQIREGIKGEEDIVIDHLIPESDIEQANYIYIATVQSCVINELFDARLAQLLAEFVWSTYPPREGRRYIAFAATREGAALLKRNHFILEMNSELTSCRRDLFVLDHERAPLALSRVDTFRQKAKRRRASSRAAALQQAQ
jgi:hypothetical protein